MGTTHRDKRWRGSLIATTKRLAETIDLEEILPRIVQDAVELLDADSGDIMLVEPDGRALRVVAEYRVPGAMVGFELPSGIGLTWQAIYAKKPIAVGEYRKYDHRAGPLVDWPYETVVCAPLISRGEAIGVLSVYAVEPNHLRRDDLQLIQAVGDHAAVALENARRHENETRLAKELASANSELVQSLTLQKRLAEQVIAGKGLQGIAEELAEIVGEPIAIVDQLGRTLAGAPDSEPDAWRRLTLPAPSANHPVPEGTDRQLIPVAWANETRAFLITVRRPRRGALDEALLEIATTGIALELVRVDAATEMERRVRGEALVDLLEGRFASSDEIGRRTELLRFDVNKPHRLLLLEPSNSSFAQGRVHLRPLIDMIHDNLALRYQSSAAIAHGNRIVILLPGDTHDGAPDNLLRLIRWLEQAIASRGVHTELKGVDGGMIEVADDYRGRVMLAHQVLTAARQLGVTSKLVHASDLGVLGVLLGSGDIPQLVQFARSALGAITEHDLEHRGQLLETLGAYLDEGANQVAVARRLDLHANTVAYRMRRIEELLGGRIRERHLDLALAVKILRVFAPADPK